MKIQTTQENTKKKNLICVISMCLGIISLVVNAMDEIPGLETLDIIVKIVSLVITCCGLFLAFYGRINAYKTGSQGYGFALTGFILNLITTLGVLDIMASKMLGSPAQLIISGKMDSAMIIFIIVEGGLVAVAVILSVIYGKVAKKYR
ncbi:MAG: hypothetical protein E7655_03395 [Ruminococcaceae bacterium]|nr:hypothetical protein [Oscillospiraceae bacterium]